MKKRLFTCLIMGIMTIGLLSGCKKKEEPVAPAEKESETQEAVVEEPETETQIIVETHEGEAKSFLSGEWVDEDIAKQRPISLMVENTSMALPQYGISNADIIYECPVEGGISRLMALFQDYSGMDKVGNVRSCRHYYAYIAKEYDSIYFHAGASKFAYNGVLQGNYIEDVDGITGQGGKFFHRDNSEKKAPHNLYTTSEKMTAAISDFGYEKNHSDEYNGHFTFAEDDDPVYLGKGVECEAVSFYYQNPKPWFEYNKEEGLYYRYEFGKPQIDGLNKEQLAAKNIIIQNCQSSFLDDYGRLDFNLYAGGTGKYITNGKCIDIRWTRESQNDITHFYDNSGTEIVLNQGVTWIELVQDKYADDNKIYAKLEEFKK